MVTPTAHTATAAPVRPRDRAYTHAMELLTAHPLIDAHNDWPWTVRQAGRSDLTTYDLTKSHPETDTDIPRLREGKVATQVLAAYLPTTIAHPATVTSEQIDLILRIEEKHADTFYPVRAPADVATARQHGKIGTFVSVESFFEAQIGFLRYIPASALTPVFLLWFGIGESPKVWLIVVGTVFFNVLMIADAARAVPRELLHASYTLGGGRRTTLRRVILRHSLPGIVDAARVNLAAAWLMLVVAEMLAADKGLAYQIVRAQRFRAVDTMFALLLVFGAIGLASDLFLRWLRNATSPWARP